ncbi:3'-5' exonuclease [Acinetobacter gerneri]|uniref:3'-5' exonuclease n=1 Tax=Acinetobacter gerneri TaxID=202952 RepID=UPI0029360CD5|nr:3'-5' exonuclease [Acinetobacter gerneri]MDV2439574.1 3'-5' exonuclease [Acinetobacter gerneri]
MENYTENNVPSREQIALYPKFISLDPEQILVIKTLEQCQAIQTELENIAILGFDTESKPTFRKGEINTGPHLIQLASEHKAYLFQVNSETLTFLSKLLSNPQQLKVGFGLKNDLYLFRKKNIELQGIFDLAKSFKSFGITNAVGIKNAIAVLFQQNFPKNKRISTSNWSKSHLSPEQISYAAADAYAALLVFLELQRLGCIK